MQRPACAPRCTRVPGVTSSSEASTTLPCRRHPLPGTFKTRSDVLSRYAAPVDCPAGEDLIQSLQGIFMSHLDQSTFAVLNGVLPARSAGTPASKNIDGFAPRIAFLCDSYQCNFPAVPNRNPGDKDAESS